MQHMTGITIMILIHDIQIQLTEIQLQDQQPLITQDHPVHTEHRHQQLLTSQQHTEVVHRKQQRTGLQPRLLHINRQALTDHHRQVVVLTVLLRQVRVVVTEVAHQAHPTEVRLLVAVLLKAQAVLLTEVLHQALEVLLLDINR